MSHRKLNALERERIGQLLFNGQSLRDIARIMGRNVSTISREIERNASSRYSYSAIAGQERAIHMSGRRNNKKKIDTNPALWDYIYKKLGLRWSPEQISVSLQKKHPDDKSMQVSPETIYTYLYMLPRGELKKEVLKYLRHKKSSRGRQKRINEKRSRIPDIISIEERPKEVEDRTIPGHWEGDLLVGKDHKSALGSIVERTTRSLILVPLKAKDALTVRKAFSREMKKLPKQMALSLTYDRGTEMTQHKLFTKETEIQVYFAHPSSPWERGTNENTNMLIRDFFPKGTDFNTITRREIKRVQKLLNERPRKTLNWETPKEAFSVLLH